MAERSVRAKRAIAAAPADLWAAVRDFCAPWHPAIDWMREERGENGGKVRVFSAGGESKEYREQLTWFSDSERRYDYEHLAGIDGAERYAGQLAVKDGGQGGAIIELSASISADGERADEIAAGTQAIFDAGVNALAAAPPPSSSPPRSAATSAQPIDVKIEGRPEIALTTAPGPNERLCLFLHGIGGSRSNWKAQLPIAAQHMTTAAMDLRGYGESALGPAQSVVDDYCADILRVVDAMNARRLILCGLSFGAWIATSFAMRHPDLLDGLALLGGCTGMSEADAIERETFRASREAPLNAGQSPADFAPDVVDIICGPNASADVRANLLASMSVIPTATYRDAVQCFTSPQERFDFSVLKMPVLLMTGEHDPLAPPGEILGVSRKIGSAGPSMNIRFEKITGAGHVCNIEKPAACNRILAEFLAGL